MLQPDWRKAEAIALDVLSEHGGIAKMNAFLAAGLTNRQVAALCARGVIERPRNAWYVDPALPWQAKCAVRVGGVLACASAAESFGLPVPPTPQRRVHALVPANSARIRHHRDRRHYVVPGEDTEVVLHWDERARMVHGWRTPIVATLIDLAGCVPEDWWVAAVDAALHVPRGGDPILSNAQWLELVERLPRRRRRALRRVDPRSESCLETLLRLGLIRRGIGPLIPQFSPDGRHRVDLLVGDRLIVEADGERFHDPEQDAIRDAEWRRRGYAVLRFSYDRIVNDLDAVLDEIALALAGAF